MKTASHTDVPTLPDDQVAAALAALAHPVRLGILRELATAEHCCKDVVECFSLAQSTISQHLRVLVEAGLVQVRKDAQRSRYALDRARIDALAGAVNGLATHCSACQPEKAIHD